MNKEQLKKIWLDEEKNASIIGWDFSYLENRYREEDDLPWDYKNVISKYLKSDHKLLDIDTGGGEFLLSLNHPYHQTFATEGYLPNVKLCIERLTPLGVKVLECNDPSKIGFSDESFDIIINRHGSYDPKEIYRLLKKGGYFITQQVGADNDFDLVKKVLPNAAKSFPNHYLENEIKKFIDLDFEVVESDEAYLPIHFYDVGALVWFAKIIEWEFVDFSVDKCFNELLKLQEELDNFGKIEGTIHRFYFALKK